MIPRYVAWLERWPTVEALAAASTGDVIRAWQGLGYNRRGLNLHRAARASPSAAGRTTSPSFRVSAATPPTRSPASRSARRAARGHERRADPGADRAPVRLGDWAGADGPRPDRLPRARAALRRLPAREPSARRAAGATSRSASRAASRARSASAARRRCGSWPSHRARSPTSTRRRCRRSPPTASSPSARWSRSPTRRGSGTPAPDGARSRSGRRRSGRGSCRRTRRRSRAPSAQTGLAALPAPSGGGRSGVARAVQAGAGVSTIMCRPPAASTRGGRCRPRAGRA